MEAQAGGSLEAWGVAPASLCKAESTGDDNSHKPHPLKKDGAHLDASCQAGLLLCSTPSPLDGAVKPSAGPKYANSCHAPLATL